MAGSLVATTAATSAALPGDGGGGGLPPTIASNRSSFILGSSAVPSAGASGPSSPSNASEDGGALHHLHVHVDGHSLDGGGGPVGSGHHHTHAGSGGASTGGAGGSFASSATNSSLSRDMDAAVKVLNPAQAAYLRHVADADNPVFRVLVRLAPVFAQHEAVEEVLYRGNVSRAALEAVLEHYADALVVSCHE